MSNNVTVKIERQRITKLSIGNLMACERVQFVELKNGGYVVVAIRGKKQFEVSGRKSRIEYPNVTAARRAVKKWRPDLEPSEF